MNPLVLYRLSRRLLQAGIPMLPRFLKMVNYIAFNCVIPPECIIGEGTRLWHSGLGIIIHPDVTIGRNCNIYNFVVFGGAHDGPDGPPIRITIGDNCTISSGVKVLCKGGELKIGTNATVAANAVVLSNVPDNVVVGGIPAVILKTGL